MLTVTDRQQTFILYKKHEESLLLHFSMFGLRLKNKSNSHINSKNLKQPELVQSKTSLKPRTTGHQKTEPELYSELDPLLFKLFGRSILPLYSVLINFIVDVPRNSFCDAFPVTKPVSKHCWQITKRDEAEQRSSK